MPFCLFLKSNVSICKGLTLTNITCDTHHRGGTLLVLVSGLCASVWLEMGTSERDMTITIMTLSLSESGDKMTWETKMLFGVYTDFTTLCCGCNKDTQIVQIPITLWPARPLGCGQPIFTQVYVALWGSVRLYDQS